MRSGDDRAKLGASSRLNPTMKPWTHVTIVGGCIAGPIVAGMATQQGAPPGPPPSTATPEQQEELKRLGSRGALVHDPSTIVKCKDEFWVYCTGRGTPSYHSKDLINWTPGPLVFTTPPSWVASTVPANRGGIDFWAPDIAFVNGRYLLYYSASTFGKNTSGIGLATNVTLDSSDPKYKWEDMGVVVSSRATDDYNTIDPAIFKDGNKLWLAFGSFWSGIKMIELDPKTGKRIAPDSPMYSLAHYESIEAAFLTRHKGWYYLFVNWGLCCRGVNSTYNIRVGRSRKPTGPYLDKEGKDMLSGGGTPFLASEGVAIGPGHAGIVNHQRKDWVSFHFYDATRRGMGTLGIRPLKWDRDGWPVAE